MRPSVDH